MITPYEIERQGYLDILDIEDDPSLSISDLKNLTAGAANVHRAAIIGRLQLDDPIKFAIDQYIGDLGLARKGSTAPINLYVNETTGSDSNSGLASNEAVRTLAQIDTLIQYLDIEALPSPVQVNITGNLTNGHTFRNLRSHIGGITFTGQPLVNGRPVTTISMGGSSQFGLRFEPGTADVIVKNLKFTGFSVGFNGYGILMKEAGVLRIESCDFDNCDIGAAAVEGVSAGVFGCRFDNCGSGFRAQYHSNVTVGASALPCVITNCGMGIQFSRNAVGHIDYCTIQDCTSEGVNVDMAARVHILGSDFRRNLVGVRVQGAAEWNNNPETPNKFNNRTSNANTQDIVYQGVGRETRLISQTKFNEYLAFASSERKSTSSGDNDVLHLLGSQFRLPPYFLDVPNRKLRFVVHGSAIGEGSKNISLRKTNASGGENELIYGNEFAAATGFIMELVIVSRGPDSQYWNVEVKRTGESLAIAGGSLTLSTVNDWLFRLYANSRDTSNTVVVNYFEVFLTP